jgi:hypothetical protein
VVTTVKSGRRAPGSSEASSARSFLTSLGVHVAVLILLLLIPAEAMRSSMRPKELEVIFHRPRPPIAVPTRAVLPPGHRDLTAVGPRREGGAKPAPSVVADVKPSAGETPGTPNLPPGAESTATEAQPQKKVGNVGILAFRDKFASLSQDRVVPRLGADARYSAADEVGNPSARTALTTNAAGSSGGINVGSLSRSVGGGGGGGGKGNGGDGRGGGSGSGGAGALQGVQVGRATSAIASIGGGERPLARNGPGPSRTDEEIQIVFDRYKASFYRLYNRELRNNPTLKGQMVLRLTIEPDGSVSMVKLQSSDMDAPDLATQVVDRVKTINFGAKDGVPAVTISYPIDFLPAA